MGKLLLVTAMVFSNLLQAATIAEGKSSNAPGEAIEAEWRAYTIYSGKEACDASVEVKELKVVPEVINLKIGDIWHPRVLEVRAVGPENNFIPGAPISISVIDDTDLADPRGAEGYLKILGAGKISVAIFYLCKTEISTNLTIIIRK
jgi:hypothetical protein